MSKSRWKEMYYHHGRDCWMVEWGLHYGYRIPGGTWLDINLGYGRILPCRLECDKNWFVIAGRHEVSFYLKKDQRYLVKWLY